MAEQRLLLHNVSWQSYVTIADALPDRPALRMTYDRGNLEFMTTSPQHEILKKKLGRMVETLAEEFNLPLYPAGNMTFRREELERGLEPDDCYWIAHERLMRARMDWVPRRDPPPDLVLEIEISRSALNRMGIYAALGVPEVWRCDGTSIRVERLQPDGTYQRSVDSPTFPGIPLAGLVPFLHPSEAVDYLSVIRSFRTWVREQISSQQASPQQPGGSQPIG
jgi:Uma2 family endonuclease